MAEEVVGRLDVRASEPDDVIAPVSAGSITDSSSDSRPAQSIRQHLANGVTSLLNAIPGITIPQIPLLGPVTIRLDADEKSVLVGSSSRDAARIVVDGGSGDFLVRDHNSQDVLRFDGRFAVLDLGGLANAGDIRLHNSDDDTTIRLDGQAGDIVLMNADVAERFAIGDYTLRRTLRPGLLAAVDEHGALFPTDKRLDRRAIGVVASAGSLRPGIVLGSTSADADSCVLISVLGRVEVDAVAEAGPIVPGDLLTSSSVPGAAMRVEEIDAARGAIVGKALSCLSTDTERVEMLVAMM